MQERLSRVLVVEDDADIRLLTQQIMQKLGCHVITAANAGEAMEYIEQEPLDLVLLDVMMPVIDGFEVLEWIRERFSMMELPVIMVTALSEDDYVVRALKMGANDYVPKPFNFNVIQARVNAQLMLKRLSEQNNEFMEITSHDLRKNVALINEVISDMREKVEEHKLGKDFEEACSLIKTSAASMKRITEDFLELQVIHDGNIRLSKSILDINKLIMHVVEQDRAYAEHKGVLLKMELDTEPTTVRADSARLEQVLANLVGNAIKFSQPGTITIIRSRNTGNEIRVEVCDEGPGFLEEEIGQVFHQKGSLSNLPTGGEVSIGMGLLICAGFIRLHDGLVGVANNSGAGATLWFSLPLDSEN